MRWPISDTTTRTATRRAHSNDEPDPIPAQQPRVVLNQLSMEQAAVPQESPAQPQGASRGRRSRAARTPRSTRGSTTSARSSTTTTPEETPSRPRRTTRANNTSTSSLGTPSNQRFRFVGDSEDDFET